jgi:hypothetical protein
MYFQSPFIACGYSEHLISLIIVSPGKVKLETEIRKIPSIFFRSVTKFWKENSLVSNKFITELSPHFGFCSVLKLYKSSVYEFEPWSLSSVFLIATFNRFNDLEGNNFKFQFYKKVLKLSDNFWTCLHGRMKWQARGIKQMIWIINQPICGQRRHLFFVYWTWLTLIVCILCWDAYSAHLSSLSLLNFGFQHC